MFAGCGVRFHTAVVFLTQSSCICLCHTHSWFLPMSWVLDLSILLSIFVCSLYFRPVYHYIAATVTVVYLAQRFITACVVVT